MGNVAISLSTTLAELKQNKPAGWRQHVAIHARKIMKRQGKEIYKKACVYCGYEHHVEVCHIKPVSEFSDEVNIVEEINCLDNLVYLCPNHHLEFDQGHIDEVAIRYFRGDYGEVLPHDPEYEETLDMDADEYTESFAELEQETSMEASDS